MKKAESPLSLWTVAQGLIALALVTGCATLSSSSALESLNGRTVYARVCQSAESKGPFLKGSSTNYIGLPQKFPVGTALDFQSFDGRFFIFREPRQKVELRLEFVERHVQQSPESWFADNFSVKPVAPSASSASEKESIIKCQPYVGMSRKAVLQALGYPPRSLTPSLQADELKYEWKRFDRRSFLFKGDQLVQIKD